MWRSHVFGTMAALFGLVACGGDAAEQDAGQLGAATSAGTAAPETTDRQRPAVAADPTVVPDDDDADVDSAESDSETSPVDSEFLESLDGTVIFASERDDGPDQSSDDLYQMNADGSEVRRLTESDRNEWWPHISPDGQTLIFGRNYPGESGRVPPSGHSAWGVWRWESGGDPVDITDNSHFQAGPRLSPDGSRILFTSSRGSRASFDDDGLYVLGDTNVWVMASDGSGQVQLTENDGSAGSWSPDGTQIAFSARLDGRNDTDIFVANADGSNARVVTDEPSNDSRPDWSPDGSHLVFDSDRNGDREIFVIDVDGSGLQQLTDNDADDDFARWSPGGDAIVFTSDRDGNSEIYVMAADGSNQTNISNDDALDVYPSWSRLPFE